MSRRALLGAALVAVVAACARVPTKDHSKLVAAAPRSILVVPVVNNTVNVEAPDYFLSTVPVPLAERGYYVFPVNLVKRLLEDDGLADAGLVHNADPARLASLFDADAVLYISIEKWHAKYVVLQTTVTVEFSYVLKDGRTSETLWEDREVMSYSSGDGGGGILGAMINAAVTKAAPNYMPLARQANARALAYPGPGFPAGPYRPEYGQDWSPGEGAPVKQAGAAEAPPAPIKTPDGAQGAAATKKDAGAAAATPKPAAGEKAPAKATSKKKPAAATKPSTTATKTPAAAATTNPR